MGRTSDARERLIQSASHLMYAKGYGAVGVKEICDHAGVNKGSFYHFFPSKRDLGAAVIDAFAGYHEQLLDRALGTDEPPLERIRRYFCLAHIGQCSSRKTDGHVRGCPVGTMAVELSMHDEMLRQRLEHVFDGWVDRFAQVLQEAADRGDIEIDDIALTARALVAYVEGVILLAKTQNDPEVVRQLADAALRLVGARTTSAA